MAQQLASNPPTGHNGLVVLDGVSQAQFLQFMQEMDDLEEQVQRASDLRKAKMAEIRDRFGKDETAEFMVVRKIAKLSGTSRERRHLARTRMMNWLGKPLGFMADMMQSDEQNVVALNAHQLREVDGAGHASGKAGHRRDSNPYTPGTEQAQRWDTAWLRGQSDLAQTLAPENSGEPKRRGRPAGSKNRTPEEKAADLERTARLLRDKEDESEVAKGEQVH